MNPSLPRMLLTCTVMLTLSGVGRSADDRSSIDQILERAHRQANLTPTPLCDENRFLRRVSLDLIGRVPNEVEIRRFNADKNRERIINQLVESEEFSLYWSQLWTTILVGRNGVGKYDREALRQWMQTQFQNHQSLDQIAFDLISAEGVTSLDGHVNFLVGNREDPVTPVSRIFLGVQLDCARCHDHPLDRWTQDDYQSMKRFFQGVQFSEVSGGIRLADRGVSQKSPKETPRFLTGANPHTAAWRRELALMTVRCKPFARAMGNRIWQLLLGRGLVEPVDGLSESNPSAVGELHDALGNELQSSGFQMRDLIKQICSSDAYRRTSAFAANDSAGHDRLRRSGPTESLYETFAARAPRALLPEQLVRSYRCIQEPVVRLDETLNGRELNRLSAELLGQSTSTSGATDPLNTRRTSQGLLNELALETGSPSGSLDSIYLSVLTRLPNHWEREQMRVVSGSDLMYALLHCNEFVFSH